MSRFTAPFVAAGFISLAVCLPTRAQEPSSRPLTVDEAVRLAIAQNPRLEAAARDIQAASHGARSARALTNPTVLFVPGVTSISGTGEEFIAQQPLELNGTRSARTAVANAELSAARAQSLIALRDTVFQTRSAYFTLARAERREQIARELLKVAQEADTIARRQVEVGARPGIDLAQTGIEVTRAERAVTLATGETGVARATLNTLLARAPGEQTMVAPLAESSATPTNPETVGNPIATSPAVPPGSASTVTQGGTPSLPPGTPPATPNAGDNVVSQAIASRGETRSATALRDRFRAEAALARAEGKPDIAPQFRVGYFTRGLQSASEGNGAGIGIAVTLPLFDYGSRKNRIRQAEEAARAQESRIAAASNEIRAEVAQAQARLSAADVVVHSYQNGTLDRAKRLLDASQLGFREGRVAVVALLEAQRSYISVQNDYADALADAAIARAALERAAGTFTLSETRPNESETKQ